MDQRKCEEGAQKVFDFKCKKIVPEVRKPIASSPAPKKPGVVGNDYLDSKFGSQTPEKTSQPLLTESKEGEVEHQERYKTLMEFFDAMVCSLRLIDLRRRSPTFRNIQAQVQVLTQREFLYVHLAQIKYILPEAIQIRKIMVHDKKTLCMKPDMEVVLLFDVVEGHHDHSNFIALRGVLASRLSNYFIEHPEVRDIPGATLPNPFNQHKHTSSIDAIAETPEAVFLDPVSQTTQSTVVEELLETSVSEDLTSKKNELLTAASHLHPSFHGKFSQKILVSEKEKPKLASPFPLLSLQADDLNNEGIMITGPKNGEVSKSLRSGEVHGQNANFESVTNRAIKADNSNESPRTYSSSNPSGFLPQQHINPEFSGAANASPSPLCKSILCADKITVETPAPSVPKRAMPSCDEKHNAMASQKQTSSHTSAKKSLDFSCSEGDNLMSDCNDTHSSKNQNLCASTLQFQKVDKNLRCPPEDSKKNESGAEHCLPGLISVINHIFQSANCSSITKEELLHKIIINSFDFVNKGEVEEQLEILEKLVPEWFCRKLAPTGDVLYTINKTSDLDSVRCKVITI